jgi:hypothetical protein
MQSYDIYNPNQPNDYESENGSVFDKHKNVDRGYTYVYRKTLRKNGKMKNQKIDIYTSGDFGSQIRDATSGNYYSERVGSLGEHLFFKVGLSTGECKSKNGSNTLFFLSPEQYEKHLLTTVSEDIKNRWLEKKLTYSNVLKTQSKKQKTVM